MERLNLKRLTKISAELGPENLADLPELIAKGLDLVLVSTIDRNHFAKTIQMTREITSDAVAIIADIPGIHRRVCQNQNIKVKAGDIWALHTPESAGSGKCIVVNQIPSDLVPEETIQFEDGLVSATVIDGGPEEVLIQILNEGYIVADSRLYCKNSSEIQSGLTESVLDDISYAVEQDVDFIAVSYSCSEDEIAKLRSYNTRILAKVESELTTEQLILGIKANDGIIFWRCPISLNMPMERICTFQKRTTELCAQLAKPLLISGHVMNSMKILPYPIRAEASDVYNGILDGVDCFVLRLVFNPNNSTFDMLINIIMKAEEELEDRKLKRTVEEPGTDNAIISSAVRSAIELHWPCILCMVGDGTTSANVSKYKASVPTLAITDCAKIARQCIVYRGIFPLTQTTQIEPTIQLLKKHQKVNANDFLILLSEIREVASYSQRMGVLRVE